MALLTPPVWLENSNDHNAQEYRVLLRSLVCGGVDGPGSLVVSEKSGTANMSVDVAAGGAFIPSSRSDDEGTYHAYNDAVANVALAAADGSNPRIDRILVQIRDEAQDGALTQNDVRFYVEQGTPAAVPVAPTISVEDYLELAQVTVPAAASSITDADIDDVREIAAVTLPAVRRYTATLTGTTSGSIELTVGTINVPAQPFAFEIVATCDLTISPSAASDEYILQVKVDGAQVAAQYARPNGTNLRTPVSVSAPLPVEIPANTAATVTATLTRTISSGGGTATVYSSSGRLLATVTPQR